MSDNDNKYLRPTGDSKMKEAWKDLGKRYSRIKYNKLVRDKIPEIIKRKGGRPKFHIANDEDYLEKLFEKFGEEVNEFLKAKNEEELADVCEVMDAIFDALADYYRIDKKKAKDLQIKKAKERGRFKKRIILEEA